MRPRPKALSSAADFGLDLPMLNTTTPRVTTRTWRYWDDGYILPAATPPIMTGTILQDLPRTCVAKETYRSASFPVAIASICDTPLTRISRIGTSMPVRPNAATRARHRRVHRPFHEQHEEDGELSLGGAWWRTRLPARRTRTRRRSPPTASELRLLVFAARWTARRGRRGLDADAPILIDRALPRGPLRSHVCGCYPFALRAGKHRD